MGVDVILQNDIVSPPVRGEYDLLSMVDMVNLSCRWLGGGSLGQKVLFRAG